MKSLRIVFLSLSFIFLVLACSSPINCLTSETELLPEILPVIYLTSDKPVLYQAGFSVLKYDFSGLIAFRKMTEEDEIRIAFISEMGLKLMEFSYQNNEVHNTFCMPAINKKTRINFVAQYLELILNQPACTKICQLDKLPNSNYFCTSRKEKINLHFENGAKKEMQLNLGSKKNVLAHYPIDSNIPDSIWIDMKYKTKIQMTLLNNAFN